MGVVVLKVGGEPVAVLIDPTQKEIEEIKASLKDLWPDERVTIKLEDLKR